MERILETLPPTRYADLIAQQESPRIDDFELAHDMALAMDRTETQRARWQALGKNLISDVYGANEGEQSTLHELDRSLKATGVSSAPEFGKGGWAASGAVASASSRLVEAYARNSEIIAHEAYEQHVTASNRAKLQAALSKEDLEVFAPGFLEDINALAEFVDEREQLARLVRIQANKERYFGAAAFFGVVEPVTPSREAYLQFNDIIKTKSRVFAI